MIEQTPVRVRSKIVATAVADEMILLDLETGTYFSLDPVSRQIFEELAIGSSVTQIVDLLVDQYAIARGEAEEDVEEFVEALLSNGVIEQTEEPSQ